MAARFRIPGLASLIGGLLKVCAVIRRHQATVRLFVPTDSLTDYDNAIEAIMNGCEIIRFIEYTDTSDATQAPWGAQ